MSVLDELLQRVAKLPAEQQESVYRDAMKLTSNMVFVPNPGPQTDAYLSQADVMLYGGQAGGGKSHLEVGWGINEAESGIIFRRERTQTDGLEKAGKTMIGSSARFNGQDLEWTWPNGKTLKLAGMQFADSWNDHAGRERDFMGFDEAGEFLEMQVASIMAWLRAPPGKRTRAILGSNPPRSSDGLWLIKWFAPWLDETFSKPAKPGELRWACQVTRGDEIIVVWVDGPGEYEIDGEKYLSKSYTFIPAALSDNPHRNTPEYRAQLQSLPEPLRSQLLYGKFTAALKDVQNQTIPSAWVKAAMDRWTSTKPLRFPMCAMGVDASGGGDDPMIIAPRHDGWYDKLIEIPGKQIPMDSAGAYCAGMVVANRLDEAKVVIDMSGGYGGPTYEKLADNQIMAYRYKGAESTTRRSKEGGLKFVNVRSAAIWIFREALDPGQPGGSRIQLPPDPRLMADLTAPTFEFTAQGIKVEPKDKVVARLGRSTDRGDAVVMAGWEGPRYSTHAMEWMDMTNGPRGVQKSPQVIGSGRQPLSVRRLNNGR